MYIVSKGTEAQPGRGDDDSFLPESSLFFSVLSVKSRIRDFVGVPTIFLTFSTIQESFFFLRSRVKETAPDREESS